MNREDGSSRPEETAIHERVYTKSVFVNRPINAAKHWFIGTNEQITKKAKEFIRSIRRYVNVAGLNRFTKNFDKGWDSCSG